MSGQGASKDTQYIGRKAEQSAGTAEALSSCWGVFIFQADTYRTRSPENFRIRSKKAGRRSGGRVSDGNARQGWHADV